jgi:hypothetical protein
MKRIRHGRRGMARRGAAWLGRTRQAWNGNARRGAAGPVMAPQARYGLGRGTAGTARQGLALLGAAWSGWRSWAWLRTRGRHFLPPLLSFFFDLI